MLRQELSTTDGAYGRPFIDNGHVHAYNDYKLGRVPVGSVENRSAWQFWNDTPGWGAVADADEVPGLHDLPDAWNIDGAVGQVSYNPYLDKYVNLVPDHAFAFNQVVIQTAPAPEGPWTPEQPLYDTNADSCGQDYTPYGSLQSPELVGDGGRTIPFVYARPGPAFGTDPNCPGQVRQVQLRLGQPRWVAPPGGATHPSGRPVAVSRAGWRAANPRPPRCRPGAPSPPRRR